jgi:hypothetical protein
MDDAILAGGCMCGAVRFEARGEPYRVGLCHCMTCRKMTGSAFSATAIYPLEAVRITGATRAFASSNDGRRHFCPTCGSAVYGHWENSGEIELSLGCFDETNRFSPTYELWIGRRENWLPEMANLVHYEGNRPSQGRTEPS